MNADVTNGPFFSRVTSPMKSARTNAEGPYQPSSSTRTKEKENGYLQKVEQLITMKLAYIAILDLWPHKEPLMNVTTKTSSPTPW